MNEEVSEEISIAENIPQQIDNPNVMPQGEMEKTCECGKNTMLKNNPSYVYAIGKISFRFPNRSIEKEMWQATGRKYDQIKGLAEPEVIRKILEDPNNRYLCRQLCWLLEIEGLPTYILVPRDPIDIERFVQALRPIPSDDDLDVIIGTRGPIGEPDVCSGLTLPIVVVDQLYSFDRDELIKAIPKQKGMNDKQFEKTADALLKKLMQVADNVGSINEHRAINYLCVRYDQIYTRTQLMQDNNYSLYGVEVRLSRLSGTRKIVDVIFTYEERSSAATEKWFVRVDVTEEFPFLVSVFQQYYER